MKIKELVAQSMFEVNEKEIKEIEQSLNELKKDISILSQLKSEEEIIHNPTVEYNTFTESLDIIKTTEVFKNNKLYKNNYLEIPKVI